MSRIVISSVRGIVWRTNWDRFETPRSETGLIIGKTPEFEAVIVSVG